jgi:hypothetical protein
MRGLPGILESSGANDLNYNNALRVPQRVYAISALQFYELQRTQSLRKFKDTTLAVFCQKSIWYM